jgi:hypothetical protein
MTAAAQDLEAQIALWRAHLERRSTVAGEDADELEDHLRGHLESLMDAGLSGDEAFLVAVKRLGSQDAIAHEFAQENSKRLWKQLVLGEGPTRLADARAGGLAAVAFAVVSAALVQLARAASPVAEVIAVNVSLVGLAALIGYLLWRLAPPRSTVAATAGGFALTALAANVYTLGPSSDALVTTALHVPILTWLLVLLAYTGGRWRTVDGRMDAIRFTGEWFIYLALLALGGGVLTGVVVGVSAAAGLDSEDFVFMWLVPSGTAGATVIAAWLVQSKQSVIENMAPVLARVFTPLFALTFAALVVVVVVGGDVAALDRDTLLICDVILVIAVGLVLYSLTARPDDARAGWFERTQLALVAGALTLDAIALVNIVTRIGEGGWTINRVVVLGLNVVLLVNLAVSAWLLARLLRGRPGAAHALERWQTALLPAYGVWALVVIVVLPPLLGLV